MHLQEFAIFNLPNYSTFASGTLLYSLFLFPPSHLEGNADAKSSTRAHIYAVKVDFSQVAKNCQVLCQTVGGVFSTFLPKIKDASLIWQTVGDALTMQITNTMIIIK